MVEIYEVWTTAVAMPDVGYSIGQPSLHSSRSLIKYNI